jgi:PKD repeat protein
MGTSGSNQFRLQLNPDYTYNFTIDWGDGNSEIRTSNADRTHTYAIVGEYDISITENVVGGFPTIYYKNIRDRRKIIELKQWGTNEWATFESSFEGCVNLTITATDGATANTGSVANFYRAWYACTSLNSFPFLNTSGATSLDETWGFCTLLSNFSLIDTSNVEDFSAAWGTCWSLTSFPHLDTSKGTSFSESWRHCTGLTSFPTLNFRKMTDGTSCFEGSTIPTSTYSTILIDLAANNINTGVTFDGGNSKYYSSAVSSRATLTGPKTWTITDGGEEVNPAPVADFTSDHTSGTAPLTVNFTDTSTNTPTSWAWDFGDTGTSTSQNPQHIYSTPGIYTVALTATNGYGSDTNTKIDYITVNVLPVANFVGSPTSGYAPLSVNFTDLSTGATSWDWDFGDGSLHSTVQNPSHTYAAGTYTVTSSINSGAAIKVRTNYITVTLPTVNFVGSPTSGDANLPVKFTDLSTGATSWSWDFGDSQINTEQNPTHLYRDGVYTASLTVNGSVKETKINYISVMSTAGLIGEPHTMKTWRKSTNFS